MTKEVYRWKLIQIKNIKTDRTISCPFLSCRIIISWIARRDMNFFREKNGKLIWGDGVCMRETFLSSACLSSHALCRRFPSRFPCDVFCAPYDWKNYSCFSEQNRKTPTWILKPLIDPRDKTLPAWDKNIARSSEPALGANAFFSV